MTRRLTKQEKRIGFTLIEVAVSMGIVGLLMAMLIPAVQNARESARRMECTSHLKQIILAYHEHAESTGTFPGPDGFENWKSQILPYLEETKIIVDKKTGKMIQSPGAVKTLACPSDPHATGNLVGGRRYSYQPSDGHGPHLRDGFYAAKILRPIRPADVTDGLSNTAGLSERLTLPDELIRSGDFSNSVFDHRLIRKTTAFIADYDAFADDCDANSVPPLVTIFGVPAYNHILTPNRRSCTNGPPGTPNALSHVAVTASSMHPGGVNVAFGDGAVRFISDSIDRVIWRSLGTRNGHEPVASF